MSVTTINPAAAQPLATYDETTLSELSALLDRASDAARAAARPDPASILPPCSSRITG